MSPYIVQAIRNAKKFYSSGLFEEAIESIDQYLIDSPDSIKALHIKAIALMALEKYTQAEKLYEQVFELSQLQDLPPKHAYLSNYAKCLYQQKEYEQAKAFLIKATQVNPRDHLDYYLLAKIENVFSENSSEALKFLQIAYLLNPQNLDYLNALVTGFYEAESYPEAKHFATKLALSQPNKSLAFSVLGFIAFFSDFDCAQAIKHLEKAVIFGKMQNKDENTTLALSYLKQGQLVKGMSLYRARFHHPKLKQAILGEQGSEFFDFLQQNIQPWQGEQLADNQRLFIIGEQGIGDLIQFARFFPQLKKQLSTELIFVDVRGKNTIVENLLNDSNVVDQTIELGSEIAFQKETDRYIYLMDLIIALDVKMASLSGKSYLKPPLPRIDDFNLPKQERFKVGLVWEGNPDHIENARRSMKFEDMLSLLEVEGVTFYSLQKSEFVKQGKLRPYRGLIKNMGAKFGTLTETAQVIEQLELVITVDTSIAHLAGAIGVETFVILGNYNTDWRWGESGDSTPWYQSVKLFRSQTASWLPVITQVREALQNMAKTKLG